MNTLEEQVLKIITENGQSEDDNDALVIKYPTDLAKEITSHVIEFIAWFTGENSPVAVLYGEQKERFASIDQNFTIEELYQYWLENIHK